MSFRYLDEEQKRSICKKEIEILEIWLRRLVHESLSKVYGNNYLKHKDETNNYLINRKISPHLFRHSFGKYLQDKGVPLSYISSMYGHSSILTTMVYLNPTNEQIKKFMEK